MSRGQHYYAQIATACDELITNTSNIPTNRETKYFNEILIKGDDPALPGVLRQLHANKIAVGTNRVAIMIQDSRAGYGITWEPSNYDNPTGPWQLSTAAEGLTRVVFTRSKSK